MKHLTTTIAAALGVALLLAACGGGPPPLPKFFGVYVLKGGQYVSVPRTTEFVTQRYNVRRNPMGASDFNLSSGIKSADFIAAEHASFKQDGFLVLQDPEWSDISLYRVPHTGNLRGNEDRSVVITTVSVGGTMGGMPWSNEYLDAAAKPEPVELKKAPIGEHAYAYVPLRPVEPGRYLVDYKRNGADVLGFNPIVVVATRLAAGNTAEGAAGRGTQTTRPVADPTQYCGVWEFQDQATTGGTQYVQVSEAASSKFIFKRGYLWEGAILWTNDSSHPDGIYLQFAHGQMTAEFASINFLPTHGQEFRYKITLRMNGEDRLDYSLWSSISGETNAWEARRVRNPSTR